MAPYWDKTWPAVGSARVPAERPLGHDTLCAGVRVLVGAWAGEVRILNPPFLEELS